MLTDAVVDWLDYSPNTKDGKGDQVLVVSLDSLTSPLIYNVRENQVSLLVLQTGQNSDIGLTSIAGSSSLHLVVV